jgi:hypothetical protein
MAAEDDQFGDETVEHHNGRPFVLSWVEKSTLDRLRAGDLVFSEAVKGLDASERSESEGPEPTGSQPSIDTSITF